LTYLFTGEGNVGCHNGHGSFGIRTASSWTKPGVRGFIKFGTDHEIVASSSESILGDYNIGEWVKLTVVYKLKADKVTLKYFIDGEFVREETHDKAEEESSPVSDFYFTITSGDTRCLYDDIRIVAY